MTHKRRVDTVLVFPPQWSPFQPPLSLPSLAAWLKPRGFLTSCVDLNIEFYEWLFSEKCARILLDLALQNHDVSDEERLGLSSVFESANIFKADVFELRGSGRREMNTSDDVVTNHFRSARLSRRTFKLFQCHLLLTLVAPCASC